jgi:probable phosphoglycerate mutase
MGNAMVEPQRIYLVRHGETEWSKSGQHTGRTDIPLTEEGRQRAQRIGEFLADFHGAVYSSPFSRAFETCRLAGFAQRATLEPDLREWDYGIYEGRTTLDIRKEDPAWSIWLSPIAGGESLAQVAARARSVIDKVVQANTDAALFAHGHILRILAACWIGLAPGTGRYLALDTASVSVLGYERKTRVIQRWNHVP